MNSDIEDLLPTIETLDLTHEQKVQLIKDVLLFMESTVDVIFEDHPAQNICGFPANDNLRNQSDSISLKGVSLHHDFKAAGLVAANDDTNEEEDKNYGT